MKYKTAQLFRFCVDDTPREFNSIDVKTQRELAVVRFLVTTRREFRCFFPSWRWILLRSEILMFLISRTSLSMYDT